MALESRRSPKTLTNGEIMEATCFTVSMVSFTELTNSDEGTFKHSNGKKSVGELIAYEGHAHRISINKSFSFVVNDGAILEQLIVFSISKETRRKKDITQTLFTCTVSSS
jgi:hypothetical protein